MKRWMTFVLVAGVALAAGCKEDPPAPVNPIDQYMQQKFDDAGLQMTAASQHELCRRMSADLLGRYVTADEGNERCGNRSADSIARGFQSSDEYLWHMQSQWRDIFDTNDVNSDWRYLKTLYDHVSELHRGNLRYDEFAIRVLSDPGFLGQDVDSVDRTRRAFNAFMGRPATDAEANDLAALFRVWVPGFTQENDPDFPYTYRIANGIAPVLCEPLSNCTAELLGGGTMDFGPQTAFEVLRYEDLDASQLEILREPGYVFTRQSFFWEAAADEMLDRLLAWSDGGRFPRTPGVVLPEVRQIVVDHLRNTGDYPATERLIMSSILYRGAADMEPDGFGSDPLAPIPPVWASGPVKHVRSEVLLNSSANITIDIGLIQGSAPGACDPRYTDMFSGYFMILQAYEDGTISLQQASDDIARLHGLQEHRAGLTNYDNTEPISYPDQTYAFVARLIGGCPGFQSTRYDGRAGLSYSFTQETLAELICQFQDNQFPKSGATDLDSIVTHQMRGLFGRDPTSADLADFQAAHATCGAAGEDCSSAGVANSVCVSLLGANEMIFY